MTRVGGENWTIYRRRTIRSSASSAVTRLAPMIRRVRMVCEAPRQQHEPPARGTLLKGCNVCTLREHCQHLDLSLFVDCVTCTWAWLSSVYWRRQCGAASVTTHVERGGCGVSHHGVTFTSEIFNFATRARKPHNGGVVHVHVDGDCHLSRGVPGGLHQARALGRP